MCGGGDPVGLTDPTGQYAQVLVPIIIIAVPVIICTVTHCIKPPPHQSEPWDDDLDYIPDQNYGGYTPLDEADALDLSKERLDDISCALVEEMITVLENRIRGRNINNAEYGGGNAGHRQRVDILQAALDRFINARNHCKPDRCE